MGQELEVEEIAFADCIRSRLDAKCIKAEALFASKALKECECGVGVDIDFQDRPAIFMPNTTKVVVPTSKASKSRRRLE
jgi:hypothetical protein